MGFSGFPAAAFEFYEALAADNSKTFWTRRKPEYEEAVRAPMHALLDELAAEFEAEVVMFRPYRDVRFAKDKSPYKTHQGGLLQVAPSVGYHVQLDAAGVQVGGGFHTRDREQTARYRAAVDDERSGAALAEVLARLITSGFDIEGDQVRTRPRGVPADHPRLDLIRREFVTAGRRHDPDAAAGPGFATTAAEDWRTLRPLVEWITSHAAPAGP